MKKYNVLFIVALALGGLVPQAQAEIKMPTKYQLMYLIPGVICAFVSLKAAYSLHTEKKDYKARNNALLGAIVSVWFAGIGYY